MSADDVGHAIAGRTYTHALTVCAITPRFVCTATDARGRCSSPAVVKVNADPLCQYHAWQIIDTTAAYLRHRVSTLAALAGHTARRFSLPAFNPSPAVWLGGDREL